MTDNQWRRLTQEAGCLDLACLTPDLLRTGQLDDLLSAWQNRGNAGALDYIDSRRDILAEPFASRPWARAALVLSFAPRPDPDSPIRRLPPARPGSPYGDGGAGAVNGLRCFPDPRRVGAVVCCPRRVSLCRMKLPEIGRAHV